ncbi:hypothetical protein L228DRAFT_25679 [Xylona heveae TC161]|uniref:BZIP domain-containing protein n=1 Tax=Xylona heveae (strain CBS 132557 / TC161) TaxID=1328760 RepID=A0A165ADM1_XYLHT|nr:hypothetical protein L228DRAFT_25679 [Xylona heveae TC161]KZF20304.1 hypothetical protein L228DRAFT_25679 [Xylona heveae TC161]
MTTSIAPTPMLAPAPALAVKLSPAPSRAASPAVHSLPPSGIVTSKEWVIPPRPKPGRKPATDIPPTKRKAQNRAAQRAFRERRAARVGELEEQMKQIEDEADREQAEMQAQISQLQEEVDRFNGELVAWRSRAEGLEQALNHERELKERAEKEVEYLRRGQTTSTDAVPLPPRRNATRKPAVSATVPQQTHHHPTHHHETQHLQSEHAAAPMGCGGCSTNARCACIEQAFNISHITYPETTTSPVAPKRPHSPQNRVSKRTRRTSEPVKAEPVELEIDFTSRFTSLRARTSLSPDIIEVPSPSATVSPMAIPDPCGFCQDGTPCVCAELENANNQFTNVENEHDRERELENNRLAPLLAPFTPPPSDTDISNAHRQSISSSGLPQSLKPATLEPSSRHLAAPISSGKSSNPCANGPGTCAQCRADPNSTLFCKSLAASRAAGLGPPGGGCCGGGGASGGCCRSKGPPTTATNTRPAPPPAPENPAARDISLSCADAYTTLARHAHFDRATDELNSWIGKLHTTAVPPPPSSSNTSRNSNPPQTRPALEVEAASVMGVLKYFDRRFGRE